MIKLRVSHSLAFVAGVLLFASSVGEGRQPPGQNEKVTALERGKVIERELSGGEAHFYQVTLELGQFLSAVVEQKGVDLIVTVIGPDGKKIVDVDSPNGEQGPELVEVTANAAGAYRLEIRALEAKAERGRYTVKIDQILTAEQAKERTASEQARMDDVKKWLRTTAIPLKGVEAGQGFDDMQPLKKLIGSARLVSLGEATHGTREFFQLKHRMLEFLVSEMGFTVFGIEAIMPEGFDINEYVLTGKGDPAKALAGLYFWTWNTEEVLEMIRWMRSYNADPRHEKKVKFYGFDMQTPNRAARVALAYLTKVDPELPTDVVQALERLANPFLGTSFGERASAEDKKRLGLVETLPKRFDERKADYVRKSNEAEWAVARQHARILVQCVDGRSGGMVKILNVRDRAMAENVQWILEHEGPGTKMVVWAHNGHVATESSNGIEWMGSHLRKRYGADMVVFGFAFNQGSFQAMEMPFGTGKGLRSFEVKPAPEGSLDATLAAAGLKVAALDLRSLPKDGPVKTWFDKPRGTRSIGAGFGEAFATAFVQPQKVPQLYDALLFVEKTTAARANPTGKRSGPTKLAAPANLGFENTEPGKPPAEWRPPSGIASASYDVVTSADNPDSGKNSAMIRRTPGPHYGETFGSVAQTIDAKAYQGQRVKLRAAVRTEVTGPGNQAHLWLRVDKTGIGPDAVGFSDQMADRPITSKEWRVVEIVGDVAKDAETINFGLALVGEGKAWLDSVSLEVVGK